MEIKQVSNEQIDQWTADLDPVQQAQFIMALAKAGMIDDIVK